MHPKEKEEEHHKGLLGVLVLFLVVRVQGNLVINHGQIYKVPHIGIEYRKF